MTNKRKGELMMVTCGVLWSCSGLILKYISWNSLLIAGGRGIFSALVIYLSMMMSGLHLRFTKKSLAVGVITFTNIECFIAANKFTTAANAVVLQYTAPVFVIIISALFLHKKLKIFEIGAVTVAFLGMILFFVNDINTNGMIGNILATVSGLFMGIMYVVAGEIEDDSERISGLVIGHFSLSIVGFTAGLALTNTDEITLVPILLIVFLGIVQMGIPYVLYGRAARMISAIEISLISMIEPILNPVWVAVFYKEIPGVTAFIGAALIIGAVIFYTIKSNKRVEQIGENI